MSTKIYVAFKLKESNNLWDFIRDTRKQAIKNIEIKLLEIEKELIASVQEDSKEYKKALKTFPNKSRAKRFVAEKLMSTEYKKASISGYRDYFDFDVYINFYELDGEIYLIPRCDMMMAKILDFLVDDDRLEDFHYQNQTDPPENISKKEFDARGDIWNKISDNGMWNSLKLDILCIDNYYLHSPSSQKFNIEKK